LGAGVGTDAATSFGWDPARGRNAAPGVETRGAASVSHY
jgi:hypothetical protein